MQCLESHTERFKGTLEGFCSDYHTFTCIKKRSDKMKRGFIYLINIESNEIEKEFTYDIRHDLELKKIIKEKYFNSGRYIFRCGCNQEIELLMSKDHKIYHKKKVDLSKHHRFCPNSEEYKKSVYFSGWNDDEATGTTTATIDFSLTPRFSQEQKAELNKDIRAITNNQFTGVTEGKLTLTALSKRLCVRTWNNRFIDAEDRFPTDRYELMRKIYGAAKNIEIKTTGRTTKNLQEIYYNVINDNPAKATCCGEEGYRFVYVDLVSIYPNLDRYTEGIYTVEGVVSLGEKLLAMLANFVINYI